MVWLDAFSERLRKRFARRLYIPIRESSVADARRCHENECDVGLVDRLGVNGRRAEFVAELVDQFLIIRLLNRSLTVIDRIDDLLIYIDAESLDTGRRET